MVSLYQSWPSIVPVILMPFASVQALVGSSAPCQVTVICPSAAYAVNPIPGISPRTSASASRTLSSFLPVFVSCFIWFPPIVIHTAEAVKDYKNAESGAPPRRAGPVCPALRGHERRCQYLRSRLVKIMLSAPNSGAHLLDGLSGAYQCHSRGHK